MPQGAHARGIKKVLIIFCHMPAFIPLENNPARKPASTAPVIKPDPLRNTGQHEREAIAADRIFGLLPPDQARDFRALWDEFEEKKTPEAEEEE